MNYGWRVFATGLSFTLFGLGGPVIALLISVFFYLTPYSVHAKQRAARTVLSGVFRHYVNFMRRCGLLTFEVVGAANLEQPGRLIVANHPSLLDVVFLISMIRNADCVVKEGLRRNLFVRAPIAAAGYISSDDPRLIDRCAESLERGSALIVFPEGTRTRPGSAVKFHRGAANIAISARCDITPVVIECRPATLLKHQKWYQIAPQPPHYVFTAMPPVAIAPYLDEAQPQGRRARQLTAFLERYFGRHVGAPGEGLTLGGGGVANIG